jgi:hypothetical protein
VSIEFVRPKNVESLLIEGNRKLALELTDATDTQVEILIGTELFIDICQRIVLLEKKLKEARP